jgi:Fe2+ or Zn2+ uptake regulation protein
LLFPKLSKTQRKVYQLLKDGYTATAIIDYFKAKNTEGMSKANVYKTIKILEMEGLYEANGKTINRTTKEIL